MTTLISVLAFIIGILLAVFVFQNTAQVRVNYLGWSTDFAPLALVILVSALGGLVLGYLLSVRGTVRRSLELRRRDRRIRELEAQGEGAVRAPGDAAGGTPTDIPIDRGTRGPA